MATVERFLNYLEFEKRFSKHTVLSYKKDLEQFTSFLKNQFELEEIEHATAPMVRSWQVHLKEAGAEARTMNRKLSCLRSFYKFCMRNGLVAKSPLYNIKAVKTPKRLPTFVEGGKMDKLLDGDFELTAKATKGKEAKHQAGFGEGFTATRDEVLFNLFYYTGMRVSELVGLKQGSIDVGAQTIKVLGKRSKERIIPLAPEMVEMLGKYLTELEQQDFPKSDLVLFYTEKGEPATRQYIYKLVNKYLGAVTTLKKKSPHVLRHTFATHMLNNDAPINDIKEILGHASLAATQVYTHNTIEKLKEVYRKAGLRKE
jgi:integrase/recombinase XerC